MESRQQRRRIRVRYRREMPSRRSTRSLDGSQEPRAPTAKPCTSTSLPAAARAVFRALYFSSLAAAAAWEGITAVVEGTADVYDGDLVPFDDRNVWALPWGGVAGHVLIDKDRAVAHCIPQPRLNHVMPSPNQYHVGMTMVQNVGQGLLAVGAPAAGWVRGGVPP